MKTEADREGGDTGRAFRIRTARPEDAETLGALVALAARVLNVRDYTPAQVESVLKHGLVGMDRQLIEDGTYFVAEAGGEIVGGGGWSFRRTLYGCRPDPDAIAAPPLDPACEAARLRVFFARPGWERRGIGRAILEHSEAEARRAGYTRLELAATHTGVPLYAACGFSAVGEVEDTLPDGERVSCVVMHKTL